MAKLIWNVNPTSGHVPLSVTGVVQWSGVNVNEQPWITVVWGDGKSTGFAPATPSGSQNFPHTYNQSGIFYSFCELIYQLIAEAPPILSNTVVVTVTIVVPVPPPLPAPIPTFPEPIEPEVPPIIITPPPLPPAPPKMPPKAPTEPPWLPPLTPPSPPFVPPIIIKPPTPTPPQPWTPFEPPITPPKPPIRHPSTTDRSTVIQFIERYGHRVGKWQYEVALDEGMDVETLEEPWRSVWKFLTHHRIDIVFEYDNRLFVAEVKPRLSITSLGQALIACDMFRSRYVTELPPRPACIVQTASPLLLQVAARNGITVFMTLGVDGEYNAGILFR